MSGAGIATLQSLPNVPVGNANLVTPRGTVDFGAAGVRASGNLNIAALQVLNSFNATLQGTMTGTEYRRADHGLERHRGDAASHRADPVRPKRPAVDCHHRRSVGLWWQQWRCTS